MMKEMTKFLEEQTMTSREIADVANKKHKHVLEAIRTMEPAWVKVNGTKFRLVDYRDAKGELRPEYQLTKTESLYIATKFNDEARAKLVVRWEELEREKLKPVLPQDYLSALKALVASEEAKQLAEAEVKELTPKAEYHDKVLDTENTFPITHIAKELGMSAKKLNEELRERGVQHKVGKLWVLTKAYQDKGYTKLGTTTFETANNEVMTSHLTRWTEKGRKFIHTLMGGSSKRTFQTLDEIAMEMGLKPLGAINTTTNEMFLLQHILDTLMGRPLSHTASLGGMFDDINSLMGIEREKKNIVFHDLVQDLLTYYNETHA